MFSDVRHFISRRSRLEGICPSSADPQAAGPSQREHGHTLAAKGASDSAKVPPICVQCQLYADNKPLTLPKRTSYKAPKPDMEWDEWMQMPFEIANLPPTAILVFTLLEPDSSHGETIFGGTTLPLFGRKGYAAPLTQVTPTRTATPARLAQCRG